MDRSGGSRPAVTGAGREPAHRSPVRARRDVGSTPTRGRQATTAPRQPRQLLSLTTGGHGPENQVLRGPAMALIAPRWEWRTFGASFGAADEILARSTPTGVAESDELYLLSEGGDNVKIRADLMDIKALRDVDRARPAAVGTGAQGHLPAQRRGRRVRRSRRSVSRSRPLTSDAYSQAVLLDELVEPGPAVRLESVHKRRVRYRFDECMVELTDIAVGDRHTRTLAIEAEDPDAVWAAVTALGLGDRVNTSVPRGLLALVGDERPRYAVIDVGTNSVKFHVGEQTADGAWRRVVDRAETTRLGDGLASSGVISAPAIERTTAAITSMVEEAWQHHAQAIVAVGTAGLRAAGNRDEVVAAIEAGTGITVATISGEEESRLAYLAVRAELTSGDRRPRRLRHGRREQPVHVRTRRRGRRPFQPRGRRRALHRALRARRGGLDRDAPSRARRDRGGSPTGWRAGRRPTPWSAWAAR